MKTENTDLSVEKRIDLNAFLYLLFGNNVVSI